MKTPILSQLPSRCRFQSKLDSMMLTERGRQEVLNYLREHGNQWPARDLADEMNDFAWELQNEDGRLIRRLAKFVQVCGGKLSDTDLTILGNLIAQHTPPAPSLMYDFTRTFNWKPGTFGEYRLSCYWKGNSLARRIIQTHGGAAIRFWRQESPKRYVGHGRAWLLEPINEVPGTVVLFNAYGVSLLQAGNVLAAHLNMSYRKTQLALHGHSQDMLYVNDAGAILLGEPSSIQGVHEVDLQWPDAWVLCVDCEEPVRWDRAVKEHNDPLCKKCAKYHD